MTDLDRLRTRAQHAIDTAVDEKWFDDESALDTMAPTYCSVSGFRMRDPRETADAFYMAAADPRVIVDMIRELQHLRRMREEDLSMIEAERQRGDMLAQGGAKIIAERDRFKADAEHWEKIARSRREHSDAKIAEMQGASILDKAALKRALAEVAAMRTVVERAREFVKRSGVAPRYERVVCESDIERALEACDAALAGGKKDGS